MAVKQKQSQKQNVNVNINLGEKKKKGKPKRRKTGKKAVKRQTQTIINPPSIINYPPFFNQNQPNNWFNPPPPIPQKQFAVFPEGETASQLGLLSNVPVPLRVEGNPLKEKEKEPILQPAPINEPFTAPVEENPFIAPAEEPIKFTAEEPLYIEPPIEPPSPTASTISGLSEEPYGTIAPSFYNVEGLGLSKVSKKTGPLPPIGQSQQPLPSSGLTLADNFPSTEYVFEEGGKPKQVKIRKGQKVKEEERLKKETITGIITGEAPTIELQKPKRKSKKTKEAFNPNQSALGFSQPVVTAEAIPAELTAQGAFNLYAPLGEQPSAQLQEKILFVQQPVETFTTQPAVEPTKAETLQRQRRVIERATAITPAEQAFLANETAFPPRF